MKKFIKSKVGQKLLSWIGAFYIKLVYKTSTWEYINKKTMDDALKTGRPIVICFWHQRLCMMPAFWTYDRPFYMLQSSHSDGQLISRILTHFKIESVYGSSTRGGDTAAIALVRLLKKGNVIGITPDGPKGPAFVAAKGVANIARLTQALVIPVTYTVSRRYHLRSWDRFLLPLPFSKGQCIFGDRIDAKTEHDPEALRKMIEDALNQYNAE
ncbi:MAG: hypothetical protein CNLJKLNK_00618 [Holosporales bacterium]